MSDPSKLVTRVEELESRLAFQDDLIESLNEVVARQDKEIVLLTKRLQELMKRLNDLDSATAGGTPEGHEIPPHY
jgi:SlyX protein